ncbi:MAG: hypothetical protein ABFD14_06395 [Anaerolineaceae bacterium]
MKAEKPLFALIGFAMIESACSEITLTCIFVPSPLKITLLDWNSISVHDLYNTL